MAENLVSLKGESLKSTLGLQRIFTYGKPVNIDDVYVHLFTFNITKLEGARICQGYEDRNCMYKFDLLFIYSTHAE